MWAMMYMLVTKKKNILTFVKDPTQGLDDTILTAEKKYSINLQSLWSFKF